MKKTLIILSLLIATITGYAQEKTINSILNRISVAEDSVTGIDARIRALADVTAPSFSSATTNTTGDSITVTMSEALDPDYVPDTSAFFIIANEAMIGVDTVTITGKYVYLTLDETIKAGESLTIFYSKPSTNGLRDVAGNQAASFNNQYVINYSTDSYSATLIESWDFEQTLVGSDSTYTGVASTNFSYHLDGAIKGEYVANINGSGKYFYVPDFVLTNSFSWSFGWYNSGTDHTDRTIVTTVDSDGGFAIAMDAENRRLKALTTNGTDSAYAYTRDDVLNPGDWQWWIVTYDHTDSSMYLYCNGEDVTADSTLRNDFPRTDTLRVGIDFDDENNAWGYVDLLKYREDTLTAAEVASEAQGLGYYELVIDTIAPSVDTATATYNTWKIYFDEDLNSNYIDTSSFNLTEDGGAVTIYTSSISNNIITFTTDTLTSGTTLSCNYDSTGSDDLRDSKGNIVDEFTVTVENKTLSSVTQLAHWRYENDATDELDTYNLTKSGSAEYTTDRKIEGSWGANLDGSGRYFTGGTIPTDQMTFTTWVYKSVAGEGSVYDNGSLSMNYNSGSSFFQLKVGGSTQFTADYSASSSAGEWVHVAMLIDGGAVDTACIYVNGSYINGGTITDITDGTIRLGALKTDAGWLYGYLDGTKVYGTLLSASQIVSDYTNPSTMVSGGSSPDPDPPNPDPTTYDIHFSQDFEDHTGLPIEYTTDIWNPDWNNPGHRDSDNRTTGWDFLPDSIVADTDGNNVLKFSFSDTIINGIRGYSPARGGDYWKTQVGAHQDIYISYNLKFKKGFNFAKGGKLPGFNGGPPLRNQSTLVAVEDDEGFSCGLMFTRKGGVIIYGYYPSMNNEKYGDYLAWDDYTVDGLQYYENGELMLNDVEEFSWTNLSTGDEAIYFRYNPTGESEWHNITVRYRMNTHDSNGTAIADGFIQGFYNGYLIFTKENMILLGNGLEGEGADELSTATFFGGDSNDMAPQADEWVYWDDMIIFEYKSGQSGVKYNFDKYEDGTILSLPNWPKE